MQPSPIVAGRVSGNDLFTVLSTSYTDSRTYFARSIQSADGQQPKFTFTYTCGEQGDVAPNSKLSSVAEEKVTWVMNGRPASSYTDARLTGSKVRQSVFSCRPLMIILCFSPYPPNLRLVNSGFDGRQKHWNRRWGEEACIEGYRWLVDQPARVFFFLCLTPAAFVLAALPTVVYFSDAEQYICESSNDRRGSCYIILTFWRGAVQIHLPAWGEIVLVSPLRYSYFPLGNRPTRDTIVLAPACGRF